MKMDTKLFAEKPPSLEEGPFRYQRPQTIASTRAPRSHCELCIQILKVILYFELILFIGWIGCLFLSSYYAAPLYIGSDTPQQDSNWLYGGARINGDDVPSSDDHSSENHSSDKNHQFMTIDSDGLIKATEQSQAPAEPDVDNTHFFIKFEQSEMSNSDEAEPSETDKMLLNLLEIMTSTLTIDDGASNGNKDWDNWEERSKNEDKTDEKKVITTENLDREVPSETTTAANTDDDEVIATENSEISDDRKTEEPRNEIMSLLEWLDMMSKETFNNSDETKDDSDESDEWTVRWKDAEKANEEKTIDSSTVSDEAELDKTTDDRLTRLIASIDDDRKKHFTNEDKFQISPIHLEPYPEMIDDSSNDDSSDVIPDNPYELSPWSRFFVSEYPHLPSSDELDAGSSNDYGRLAWYDDSQSDKDDVILRWARQIGTKVDSDSNSSSDETTTPAPKTKRSAESSSEESDESGDKARTPDSSPDSVWHSDAATKILTELLSKYFKTPGENGTPRSDKAFEKTIRRLSELLNKMPKSNSTDTPPVETAGLDNRNIDKAM